MQCKAFLKIFFPSQIYHLGLNTLVSSVIPLTLMTFLNLRICSTIRKKAASDRVEFCTLRTPSQSNCKVRRTNSYRVQLPANGCEAEGSLGSGRSPQSDPQLHHDHHSNSHVQDIEHVHHNPNFLRTASKKTSSTLVHSEIDDDEEVASLMATGKDMETSFGANEVVITVATSHPTG